MLCRVIEWMGGFAGTAPHARLASIQIPEQALQIILGSEYVMAGHILEPTCLIDPLVVLGAAAVVVAVLVLVVILHDGQA